MALHETNQHNGILEQNYDIRKVVAAMASPTKKMTCCSSIIERFAVCPFDKFTEEKKLPQTLRIARARRTRDILTEGMEKILPIAGPISILSTLSNVFEKFLHM